MSLIVADVMMLSENEKSAVKPATAPRRPGMLLIAHKTAIPATGRREATRVDSVLRTLNVPSLVYLMVFGRKSLVSAFYMFDG